MTPRAFLLTTVALICFAGNSLLCRLALADHQIDAASFTAIRLGSGAVMLVALARGRPRGRARMHQGWTSAVALFAYAAPFSFAYLRLGAAMGALLLFAAVQASMLAWAIGRHGERPGPVAWLGIAGAVAGLAELTLPGKSAPDPIGAVTMLIAGVAWGVYSLKGRATVGDAVVTTSGSFVLALPMAVALLGVSAIITGLHATARGVVLATASGALASGAGYAVWYAALRHLSTTRAAVVQLLSPVLAAVGAVLWLGEHVSLRLVLASGAILGGVALTIRDRSKVPVPPRRFPTSGAR